VYDVAVPIMTALKNDTTLQSLLSDTSPGDSIFQGYGKHETDLPLLIFYKSGSGPQFGDREEYNYTFVGLSNSLIKTAQDIARRALYVINTTFDFTAGSSYSLAGRPVKVGENEGYNDEYSARFCSVEINFIFYKEG